MTKWGDVMGQSKLKKIKKVLSKEDYGKERIKRKHKKKL